ncbi:MAG: hypothetical protein K2V38_09350 [Gemmataceae bacterium]|nr:hypothetical protein [Gemmataceae bacterium]
MPNHDPRVADSPNEYEATPPQHHADASLNVVVAVEEAVAGWGEEQLVTMIEEPLMRVASGPGLARGRV